MELSDHGFPQYTKEEIINMFREWYGKNGKIRIRDLKHKNKMPTVYQVIDKFGSFQNCLIESDIEIDEEISHLFNVEKISDGEFLDRFKEFADNFFEENGYLPETKDIKENKNLPVSQKVIKRYGGIDNLYLEIGYDRVEINNQSLKEDMIKKYKSACDKYGRVLNSRDITRISKHNEGHIYSMESYIRHFGSLSGLQKLCGFNKTVPGRNITRQELIEKLLDLSNILGRNPIQADLILYDHMPSSVAYNKEFGNFQNALKETGLSYKKVFKTKNGVRCNSRYELKLAQVLESYDIKFENEIYYKTVIPNFKKKYRFDFVIEINYKKYYIEFFGIEGNKDYDKRRKEKISLCKKYDIPLIDLYQSDIYAKTNREIYETLISYINKIDKEVA